MPSKRNYNNNNTCQGNYAEQVERRSVDDAVAPQEAGLSSKIVEGANNMINATDVPARGAANHQISGENENSIGINTPPTAGSQREGSHACFGVAEKASEVVEQAKKSAEPYVEQAKSSALPYVEGAKASVENMRETAVDMVNQMKKSAEPYVEQAKFSALPYVEGAKASVENVKERAAQLQHDAEAAIDHAKKAAAPYVQNAKENISKKIEPVVEKVERMDVPNTAVFGFIANCAGFVLFCLWWVRNSIPTVNTILGLLCAKSSEFGLTARAEKVVQWSAQRLASVPEADRIVRSFIADARTITDDNIRRYEEHSAPIKRD